MEHPGEGEHEAPRDWVTLPPPYASLEFSDFLAAQRVSVLDVVPGAAFGTRRLLVGDPATGVVTFAAAVGQPTSGDDAIGREEHVLTDARPAVRASVRVTLPRVVERVEVFTNVSGLVVTGVPGLRPAGLRPPAPAPRELFTAMDAWLTAVWRDTAARSAEVRLGAEAVDALLSRYAATSRLQPALEWLRSACQRLAEYRTPRVLTHGCLCLRHVMFADGQVIGVDDWGLASTEGEQLGDAAGFAARLAGDRLPEVLAGRTSYAALHRHFVGAALSRLGVSRQLWREALMLAQLELAIAALEHDDHDEMVLLARAVDQVAHHTN